ncbi:MAG: hypothetical protein JW812_01125 [Alphaproteobacteria bacterium]|nr:hypothetical protein [Alphaproteobacteria bacterium]MBN2779613.1 hypothetical protein [Alphaproteobacteria bacterium]
MITDLQFIVLLGGRSTRNYPHSKGLPHKALLPFGDFKVINFILQNIYDAGGRDVNFVIAESENTVFFNNCFKREPAVEAKFENKHHLLALLKQCYLPDDLKIDFTIQSNPLGIGHAIALAAKNDRNAYVVLPDDVILSQGVHPFTRAVLEYEKTKQGNIVITRPVDDPSRWGIIEHGMYVEKPKQSTSNEAVISSLILDKAVIRHYKSAVAALDAHENTADKITQVDAINFEVQRDPSMKIRTVPLSENDLYLDCGTIAGYEKALLYTLLKKSYFKNENKKYLEKVLTNA